MKLKILTIALFVLFSATSITAQTSADLQTKYGKSLEAYEVRPNVLMTVEYTKNGEILEAVIETRHTHKKSENNSYSVTAVSVLSPILVAEIIEEIAPASERGRRLNQITFYSSCNSIATEKYENVEILWSYKCGEVVKGSSELYAVQVRWRKRL